MSVKFSIRLVLISMFFIAIALSYWSAIEHRYSKRCQDVRTLERGDTREFIHHEVFNAPPTFSSIRKNAGLRDGIWTDVWELSFNRKICIFYYRHESEFCFQGYVINEMEIGP